MIAVNLNPDRRTLRIFAGVWLAFFALAGGWIWWRHGSAAWGIGVWAAALPPGLLGLFVAPVMRVLYVGMSLLTYPIGWLLSRVVLAAVFYLTVTPIGLAMRLLGRDPLHRRFDPGARTYWVPRAERDDPRRCFRQF